MDEYEKLFTLYRHQEAAFTNRTNLMIVAQSFLVVGFVGAISNWLVQLFIAILGIFVTLLTVYVSGRELEFFYMVRNKLTTKEPIFREIDKRLKEKPRLDWLGRASRVLCAHLQYLFLGFWSFCFIYSLVLAIALRLGGIKT